MLRPPARRFRGPRPAQLEHAPCRLALAPGPARPVLPAGPPARRPARREAARVAARSNQYGCGRGACSWQGAWACWAGAWPGVLTAVAVTVDSLGWQAAAPLSCSVRVSCRVPSPAWPLRVVAYTVTAGRGIAPRSTGRSESWHCRPPSKVTPRSADLMSSGPSRGELRLRPEGYAPKSRIGRILDSMSSGISP